MNVETALQFSNVHHIDSVLEWCDNRPGRWSFAYDVNYSGLPLDPSRDVLFLSRPCSLLFSMFQENASGDMSHFQFRSLLSETCWSGTHEFASLNVLLVVNIALQLCLNETPLIDQVNGHLLMMAIMMNYYATTELAH